MAVRLKIFHPNSPDSFEVKELSGLPGNTFKTLCEDGLDWEIDLSQADETEARDWRSSHIAGRINHAFKNNKPVMRGSAGGSFTRSQDAFLFFVRHARGKIHFSETSEAIYLSVSP